MGMGSERREKGGALPHEERKGRAYTGRVECTGHMDGGQVTRVWQGRCEVACVLVWCWL